MQESPVLLEPTSQKTLEVDKEVATKVTELEPEIQSPELEDEAIPVEAAEPEVVAAEPTKLLSAPSKIAGFEPIASGDVSDDDLFGTSPAETKSEAEAQGEALPDPLPQENPSDAEPPPYSEDLPPDFWDSEPVKTETTAPVKRPPAAQASVQKSANAEPPKTFDKDAPVLEQLQSLFPGRITRIDPLEPTTDGATKLDEDVAQEGLFD